MDKRPWVVARTTREGTEVHGLFTSSEEAWNWLRQQGAWPGTILAVPVEVHMHSVPTVEITKEGDYHERVDGIPWVDATMREYGVQECDATDGEGEPYRRRAL